MNTRGEATSPLADCDNLSALSVKQDEFFLAIHKDRRLSVGVASNYQLPAPILSRK
jgi:hypothetical protein